MYFASGILILSFGFSMLEFISCYSDGSLIQDQCQGMNIVHLDDNDVQVPAQGSVSNPFSVDPDNVTFTDSQWGTASVTVTLTANSGQFRGFILDARACDNCASSGTFTLVDSGNSLLICNGRVVAHTNNLAKSSVSAVWRPEAAGMFFFRAAFVQEYYTFWERKTIILPTTSTTTTSTTTSSTTPTIKPTPLPSPPQCVQYVRCVLALLLFSRLCFLGGSSLLIIIKLALGKKATWSASVLELVSKIIAVILVLIKHDCEICAGLWTVFTALTVTSMISSLLHTIAVFLPCGPSHELRKHWLIAIILVDLINTVITTIAIFVGLCCFEDRWLLILMAVYVIWEIMFYIGTVCCEQTYKKRNRTADNQNRANQNRALEKRRRRWLFMFIIFTILNVLFTVALIIGVSLVRII